MHLDEVAGMAERTATRLRTFVSVAENRRRGLRLEKEVRIARQRVTSAMSDFALAVTELTGPLPEDVADLAQVTLFDAEHHIGLLEDGIPLLVELAGLARDLERLAASARRPGYGVDMHVSRAIDLAMRGLESADHVRESRQPGR